jgi:hypothetical protein
MMGISDQFYLPSWEISGKLGTVLVAMERVHRTAIHKKEQCDLNVKNAEAETPCSM